MKGGKCDEEYVSISNSKELEQYRSILEESVKPYIKVSGTLAETTLLKVSLVVIRIYL